MFKRHAITSLTAEELDTIVQHLAVWGLSIWNLNHTDFEIKCDRNYDLHTGDKYALYSISFPMKVWKRIRKELSDAATEVELLNKGDES